MEEKESVFREATDEEIKEAYKIAKKLAMDFMRNHYIAYLTIDDYVQEGVIAWLHGRDIKNAFIDLFRKGAPVEYRSYGKTVHSVPLSVPYEDTLASGNEDVVRNLDESIDLKKAVMKLTPKQRAAFWMVHVKGYSFQEVADKLHVTRQAIEQRFKNALTFLRKEYSNA